MLRTPAPLIGALGAPNGGLMNDFDAVTIIVGLVVTWAIGLALRIVIRFAILRRPLGKQSSRNS